MSAPCPHCGGDGILATNVLFDLYRCTKCKKEYFAQHPLCQHPSCASWTDNGTDYCYYHLAQQGIYPEAPPKDPSLCNAPECTREKVDGDLCDFHAWES